MGVKVASSGEVVGSIRHSSVMLGPGSLKYIAPGAQMILRAGLDW
jgi:hypothetical protein